MKSAWLALLLALAASGCASRELVEPPLVAAVAPAAERDRAPAAPPRSEPLRELLLQVAAARGLEPGPLPMVVDLPARQLARRALEHWAHDLPEAVRRAQAQLLWRLELVPRDFDLSMTLERAFVGQLQAFYVGSPPTLFVDRALRGAERQRALAHELVHALQDQRHALTRRLEYEPDGWDRQSALHALAEADALALVEHLGGTETIDPSAFEPRAPASAVPGVIACSLAAPYLDARARVNELLAQGGFGAVDAVLRDPPRSTHQLLHPGEQIGSAGVEPFRAPGSNWTAVYGDVLGEQSLRCVLEEWVSAPRAAELAGGWAADRVTSFVRGAATAIVWELTFAHPTQAADVARLLVTHLDLGPAWGQASAAVSEWICGAHSDTGVVAVWRKGVRLVFASLSVPVSGGCVSLAHWVRGTGVPDPSLDGTGRRGGNQRVGVSHDLGPGGLTGRLVPRHGPLGAAPGARINSSWQSDLEENLAQ